MPSISLCPHVTPDLVRLLAVASFHIDHVVLGYVHRHLIIKPGVVTKAATVPATWSTTAALGGVVYPIDLATYRKLATSTANRDGSFTDAEGVVGWLSAVGGRAIIESAAEAVASVRAAAPKDVTKPAPSVDK